MSIRDYKTDSAGSKSNMKSLIAYITKKHTKQSKQVKSKPVETKYNNNLVDGWIPDWDADVSTLKSSMMKPKQQS